MKLGIYDSKERILYYIVKSHLWVKFHSTHRWAGLIKIRFLRVELFAQLSRELPYNHLSQKIPLWKAYT